MIASASDPLETFIGAACFVKDVGLVPMNYSYVGVQMAYNESMTTVSVSELRANLKTVLESVKRGEEVRVTQNGEVVAAVLHPDALQWRVKTPNTLAAERLLATFDVPTELPEPTLSRAEGDAFVTELRQARDAGR